MSAVQLPLAAAPHRNQQLFSDYYLNTILPERGDWQLLAADARPLLARLQAIYAAFTPSSVEAHPLGVDALLKASTDYARGVGDTLKQAGVGDTLKQATPVQGRQGEALGLERRLAALVNAAYGLTREDVATLWRTAPPRMPVGQP